MAKELYFNHDGSAMKKLLVRILDSVSLTLGFGSSQDVSELVCCGAGRSGHGGWAAWCDIGSKGEKCCAAK